MLIQTANWSGRLPALLVLIFLVAGCRSSDKPSTESPTPAISSDTSATPIAEVALSKGSTFDVCSLVSAKEMSEIVGEMVSAQAKTLQTGIPSCSYKAASGNPIPGVTIGLHQSNGKQTYKNAQSFYKSSSGKTEVSGIGEQAFDSGDGTFYALKGDNCLDIVLTQQPDLRLEQFKKIATLAVSRLS